MNEAELDIIDLNDWILLNHPDVYQATKYIGDTTILMRIWTIIWREDVCPEIREL